MTLHDHVVCWLCNPKQIIRSDRIKKHIKKVHGKSKLDIALTTFGGNKVIV